MPHGPNDQATQWLLDQMHNPKASLRHRIECAKTLLEVHGHEFEVRWLRDPRDETVVTIKVIIGGIGPTAIMDHVEREPIAKDPSPARLN
jgi:hypothetical protein